MSDVPRKSHWRRLAKIGAVVIIINEIRGLIMAGPVLYATWQAGGDAAALWLAICALGGIALSVAVPWWIARRLTRRSGRAPI